ncbi:MAG: aromatic amino acid ammonia-lyase [Deltaproteobacteria bacterium]|jgi:histidine ammonia-lyase|nr:aromatic amino acid ammonia-lyase [Deltaproteobacteria bacterium]
MSAVILTGEDLTIKELVSVTRGFREAVIAPDKRENIQKVRRWIEDNWMREDAPPIYGFTTGLGKLKDTRISPEQSDQFQINIVRSHSGCVGEPLPEEVVRAAMLVRVNLFCRGVCGLRLETVERLLEMVNKKVHPVVPSLGSVGCSGDLGPLAHIVAAMIGFEEAEAVYGGVRMPAREALKKAGMSETFELKAKDALSLVNGTTVFAAYAALNVFDALELAKTADLTGALSLEAMRGERNAFDPRYQAVGNHPGQAEAAENVLKLVSGSTRCSEESRMVHLKNDVLHPSYKPRIQDLLSLRCLPQVHGSVRDNLKYSQDIIEREINAVTDNPLVFWNDKGGLDFVSGGNSHGEPVGFAMDNLCLAMTELGNISERRIFALCDPCLSYGLPPMLAGEPAGLNCGYPVVACSAAAITSENKTLCFPSSADSLTTKSSQEDHVSMAPWAARKARQILGNLEKILGIETLIASQAIMITRGELGSFKLGAGTGAAFDVVRRDFKGTDKDEYMPRQSNACIALIESREMLRAAEGAVGGLA